MRRARSTAMRTWRHAALCRARRHGDLERRGHRPEARSTYSWRRHREIHGLRSLAHRCFRRPGAGIRRRRRPGKAAQLRAELKRASQCRAETLPTKTSPRATDASESPDPTRRRIYYLVGRVDGREVGSPLRRPHSTQTALLRRPGDFRCHSTGTKTAIPIGHRSLEAGSRRAASRPEAAAPTLTGDIGRADCRVNR